MALKMYEKFLKYWSTIHGMMGVASLLDPRHKTLILEYYLEKIFGAHEAQVHVKEVVDICSSLLAELQSNKSTTSEATTSLDVSSTTSGHMQAYAAFRNTKKNKKPSFKSELEYYLDDDALPVSNDFDILAWWKSNWMKYPSLEIIARDVLAIPITSVASECAFSMGGRILSPHRNKLLPTMVEALACCQNWLWAEKGISICNFNFII